MANEVVFDSDRLIKVIVDSDQVPIDVFNPADYPQLSQVDHRVALVTWYPMEMVQKQQLTPASICGVLTSPRTEIGFDTFLENKTFVEVLQTLNMRFADPRIVEACKTSEGSGIAVIDQRTADPQGRVPNEDIMGVYKIAEGRIVGYNSNPNYKLYTSQGVFRLTPWLRKILVELLLLGHTAPQRESRADP